jgi:hypothetical protein
MVTRLHFQIQLAIVGVGLLLGMGSPVRAEVPPSILQAVMKAKAELAEEENNPIQQAQCSSCSGGLFGSPTVGGACGVGCGPGGCSAGCFPGQLCTPCEGEGFLGRTFARLHNCICCPDPCYEPRWHAAANAAFFQDAARPVTMTRIRWDHATSVRFPDRNNFLFPTVQAAPVTGVSYDNLLLSMEAGGDAFSITVDTLYRNIETPNQNWGAGTNHAGFGDIAITTKSLLIDCELLQLSFQFRTGIPTGSSGNGLGLGLVSLEPSLLFSVKLWEETYFQSQISEWIPLGSSDTAGSLLHYHFALNHVLWRAPCCHDMLFVGTLEANCISFQAGNFTNEAGVLVPSSGTTYVTVGPGLRYQLCERMDFGVAAQFAVTQDSYAEQLYRTEFRWRF